jgi:glutathione peroxidase
MSNAHKFTFPGLNGARPIALGDLAGRVVLLVNVASACGFTPQYRALQQLHEAKAEKGLTVIGAPCNDFGRQEPNSELEISAFCEKNYAVTFPMTGKIEILGAHRHPFYDWISKSVGEAALPKWNFHKYLIGKDGTLAGSYPPNTAPLSPEFLAEIKAALEA